MKNLSIGLTLVATLLIGGCKHRTTNSAQLTVAAAANLSDVFQDVGSRFTAETGIPVVFSFGATAELTKQIENGAPFDVFASADVEHINELEGHGLLTNESRAVYARGRLIMWLPSDSKLHASRIQDITDKSFERISIAKPDVAPYGRAAVDSLRALGIWDQIESRVVYAQNVSQAKQYAATGNAEVAFIPMGLVKPGEGTYIEVDETLHAPIDQALGIIKDSPQQEAARKFVDFVLGSEGQDILSKRGYSRPTMP